MIQTVHTLYHTFTPACRGFSLLMLLGLLLTGPGQLAAQSCGTAADRDSFTYNNNLYLVVRQALTWQEASACAVQWGGRLVEVNNQAEQDTLASYLLNQSGISPTYTRGAGGVGYIWLGGTDSLNEGAWSWDGDNSGNANPFYNGQGAAGNGGGAPVGGAYTNWGGSSQGQDQEPDDFQFTPMGQDYLGLALGGWPFGIAGEWNDLDNGTPMYFAVEIDQQQPCNDTLVQDTQTVCLGDSFRIGNSAYADPGDYVDTLLRQNGCDSVVELHLDVDTAGQGQTLRATAASLQVTNYNPQNTYVIRNCNTDSTYTLSDSVLNNPAGLGVDSFSLIITNARGCSDTSACQPSTPNNRVDPSHFSGVSLYPNPVHQQLTIEGLPPNTSLQLLDLQGRVLQSFTPKPNAARQLDLSRLAPGAYLLQLEQGVARASYRLLKR